MAGTSLLALIDDIATLLDDIGVLTKTAASKTAGVLGDDLALNAEQVSGVRPERELPVVWAVAKGSALNKLILVPVALALSAFLPWMVSKLLMAGGAYLCFEGCEKVAHSLWGKSDHEVDQKELRQHLASGDLVDYEKKKIKGAILTDFILSAEIVVITLGTVRQSPIVTQAIVMTLVAAVLTVGVYAIVAAIVKLDDVGLALAQHDELAIAQRAGRWILWFAPRLLKILGVLGTIAMFLVGGGIWVHSVGPLAHFAHGAEHTVGSLPHVGTMLGSLTVALINLTTGTLLGAAALGLWTLLRFAFRRVDAA